MQKKKKNMKYSSRLSQKKDDAAVQHILWPAINVSSIFGSKRCLILLNARRRDSSLLRESPSPPPPVHTCERD